MVKLIVCLKRKPGMSEAEFHRYWKDVHGPLVKSVPEFYRYVRRYVQSHTVSPTIPGFDTPPAPFDGVAELWFDNLEEMRKAYAEPKFHEILVPDGLKFFDVHNAFFFAVEEIVF